MIKVRVTVSIVVILTIVIISSVFLIIGCNKVSDSKESDDIIVDNPYSSIVNEGYTGTEEELIASLVGETVEEDPNGEKESAYLIACKKGYTGGFDKWMNTLTGKTTSDTNKSAYQLMVDNGYKGTLVQWLTSIVEDVDELGHSEGDNLTEYELACQYGFEGNFIEWMVSLVNKGGN